MCLSYTQNTFGPRTLFLPISSLPNKPCLSCAPLRALAEPWPALLRAPAPPRPALRYNGNSSGTPRREWSVHLQVCRLETSSEAGRRHAAVHYPRPVLVSAASESLRLLLSLPFPCNLQAGAGIVADSRPEAEYEETVNKSAALGRAIDLAEAAFVEGAGSA